MCLKHYGWDPVFYSTFPNFAYDATFKFTGETDLVCDQNMLEMMDAGLRGGMTQTT